MTTVKPYLCGGCDESFSRYKELDEHRRSCKGEEKSYAVLNNDNEHFSCAEPDRKIVHYKDLSTHNITELTGSENKTRSLVTYSAGNLRSTMYGLIHNNIIEKGVEKIENHWAEIEPEVSGGGLQKGTKYTCEQCNIEFSDNFDLENHIIVCVSQTQDNKTDYNDKLPRRLKFPRRCAEYGYQFRDGISYGPWDLEDLTEVLPEKSCSEKKRYECSDCGKRFRRKHAMELHMQSHTERKPFEIRSTCDLESKLFSKEIGPLPMISQELTNLVCPQCEKVFKTKATLRLHMRTHTGLKPFQCTECGKCFSRKGNLQTHMRCHTGEKPCKCEECGKTFRHISGLRYHIGTHNRVQPYPSDVVGKNPPVCSVCGKFFKHESGLKYHMKTHSNEKPFECTMCGKLFKGAAGLKYHIENHPSTMKDIRCDECGEVFRQMKDLNIHKRVHLGKTVHICDICNKHFLHSYNLKVHLGVHSEERPYHCQQCGKYFKRSEGLKNHLKTHMDMEALKRTSTELLSMAETHL